MRLRSLFAGLGLVMLLSACAHVPARETKPSGVRAMTLNIRLDTASDLSLIHI